MIKKILVLHTGGTISMSADDDGRVSQNADNPMNHVGFDLDNLELTVVDFLNIPSPHITPYHMLDIYKKSRKQLGNMMVWSSPTEQIPWKKRPTS